MPLRLHVLIFSKKYHWIQVVGCLKLLIYICTFLKINIIRKKFYAKDRISRILPYVQQIELHYIVVE